MVYGHGDDYDIRNGDGDSLAGAFEAEKPSTTSTSFIRVFYHFKCVCNFC